MIVKNESEVIERGLRAVLPYMHSWCSVDTGSTDDTKEIIERVAADMGVRGVLYDRPWVNFAHNRSEALRLCREQAPPVNHMFMIDADDIFHGPATARKLVIPKDVDALQVKCVMGGNAVFYRLQCFSTHCDWLYKGVLHEYPDVGVENGKPRKVGSGDDLQCWIDVRTEGCRSKNPKKYEDDAVQLDAELAKTPNDTRYQFYAAQSWRDAGNHAFALERYVKRAEMTTGYVEEQYVALLNAIRLTPSLPDAVKYAWKALDINRQRREATTALFCRAREHPPSTWTQELFSLGLATEVMGSRTVLQSFLFAESPAYAWSFADEFSIICFFTGHKHLSIKLATEALLAAPEAHKPRINKNMEQALKLPN